LHFFYKLGETNLIGLWSQIEKQKYNKTIACNVQSAPVTTTSVQTNYGEDYFKLLFCSFPDVFIWFREEILVHLHLRVIVVWNTWLRTNINSPILQDLVK